MGSEFPSSTIFEPFDDHTHTVIMLHGRGSTGAEFAEEFFESELSTTKESLRQKFSNYRWVFPSSGQLWSSVFQENMPAWFDISSLADPLQDCELQMPGIKASLEHLRDVLDQEIGILQDNSRRVILGGISQGTAIGLYLLLSQSRPLGGFFGASGWLPFYNDVKKHLHQHEQTVKSEETEMEDVTTAFVREMIAPRTALSTSMPVLLGHGVDDIYVDIKLGNIVKDILQEAGYTVEWKEYKGAEQEGHWFKEPEEIDDIASFLIKTSKS